MRIISEKPIRAFWRKYPQSKQSLQNWILTTGAANWNSFADLRKTFNHTDLYERCTIFDVGGNNYRLIAHVEYRIKCVFVRYVLTHSEYDENKWKDDC